ncbi:MAG: endonuclease domain-containing protein [Patescibacteria group bacterium]
MYNDQKQKERRRELRKNQTEAEKILWQKIRNRQINNFKFHRQYSAGPYILDFFCPEIRLVIELDGEQHKDTKEYDKERELFLKDKDINVIRFWNNEVLENIENILNIIRAC